MVFDTAFMLTVTLAAKAERVIMPIKSISKQILFISLWLIIKRVKRVYLISIFVVRPGVFLM